MEINKDLKREYPWRERWVKRMKIASGLVPCGTSVTDLGGGLGDLYWSMRGECDYVSIDLKPWTDKTLVADFNRGEFPPVRKADFIVCLGLIEYIEYPETFLESIKKYGDVLVISYRTDSDGGMTRKNRMGFFAFWELLVKSGWKIETALPISGIETIFKAKI